MVILNRMLRSLMIMLGVLVLLIQSQNLMASPEEYQWLSTQKANCIQASVWKHCVLPPEIRVSKLKFQAQESKPLGFHNLERLSQTPAVEFGLIQQSSLLPTPQLTYRQTLMEESSLWGLPLKVSTTLSQQLAAQYILITFKLQF